MTKRTQTLLDIGEILEGDHAGQRLKVALELMQSGRVLLQAGSGAGKSETIRRIVTATIPHVPNVLVDPESEYAPLRSQFPFLLVGKGGEVPAVIEAIPDLVRLIMETGVSVIFDLFELGGKKFEYAAKLFEAFDRVPVDLRRDLIFTIDEAHIFAPKDVSLNRPSSTPMADLASRGRKRGYTMIVATQRLPLLHNDVAALCENLLFGRTGLIDQKSVSDRLGFAGNEAKVFRKQLGRLNDGDFYAYGRAFGEAELTKFHVERVPGPTLAKAGKSGSARRVPPTPEQLKELLPKFMELPAEVLKKVETEKDLRKQLKDAQEQIRRLEKASGLIPAASPIDKEKLRMLTNKLKTLGEGLEEAQRLSQEQDATRETVLELIASLERHIGSQLADLRKKLGGSASVSRALRNAAEAQAAAVSIVPQLSNGADVVTPAEMPAPVRAPKSVRSEAGVPEPGTVSEPMGRILNAMAWAESAGFPCTNTVVAYLSGYSPSSSGFKEPRAKLKNAGLIEYTGAGESKLTDAGRRLAVYPNLPPSGEQFRDAVLEKLPAPARKLLSSLIANYPEPMSNPDLAAATGYSHTSSGFKEPRALLSSLGLADYPAAGMTAAASMLFPET